MLKKLDIGTSEIEQVEAFNALVDAVNQLVLCEQARTCYELIHKNETPADQYAEQRKWIGKLCWFWFNNREQADIGILDRINEDNCCPYFNADLGYDYEHCEPVKLDDDIIYKG